MRGIFFIILMLASGQSIFAQDSSGTKQEGWPEVNLYYKINNKLRLYSLYSATRLKNSDYTDGGVGVFVDYFSFPALRKKFNLDIRDSSRGYYLWLRGGYYYSTTPKDAKEPVSENTIVTEFNLRFHLPYDILLTNKNRFDWRIINGDFEPRYRNRVTFEKDMHTEYLTFTPYFYGEVFLPLTSGSGSRLRLCAGAELRVSSHINFETYLLHQFENGSKVPSVDAVGIVFKFYLDHQDIKQKIQKKKQKNGS